VIKVARARLLTPFEKLPNRPESGSKTLDEAKWRVVWGFLGVQQQAES
jgi:hypothetical protein